MEKLTPHCKLSIIKALIADGKIKTTRSAREGAAALGFDFDGMLAVIDGLTAADFYKT